MATSALGAELEQTKKIENQQERIESAVRIANAMHTTLRSRASLAAGNPDERRDLYKELGYPEILTFEHYYKMYEREGYGNKVVEIFPKASWRDKPRVIENEDPEETPFEKAFMALEKRTDLCYNWLQVDIVSGVGTYGVLFLGFDDGQELSKPIKLNKDGHQKDRLKLMYVRPLDCDQAKIKEYNRDDKDPRYGWPENYTISLSNTVREEESQGFQATDSTEDVTVHWSRVIHIAEHTRASKVHATPRQKPVFNYLYNIQKVLGGSGEMFWQAGNPGLAFTTQPDRDASSIDLDLVEEQIFNYINRMQKFLAVEGLDVNALTTEVSSPKEHVEVNIEGICTTLDCPVRVFKGSERGELASSQDKGKWNDTIKSRQVLYVGPLIIDTTIVRLVQAGALPVPAEWNADEEQTGYEVSWEDLEASTDMEKAEVANAQIDAISKYIAGDVSQIISEKAFLKIIMKLEEEEVDALLEFDEEDEDEIPGEDLERELDIDLEAENKVLDDVLALDDDSLVDLLLKETEGQDPPETESRFVGTEDEIDLQNHADHDQSSHGRKGSRGGSGGSTKKRLSDEEFGRRAEEAVRWAGAQLMVKRMEQERELARQRSLTPEQRRKEAADKQAAFKERTERMAKARVERDRKRKEYNKKLQLIERAYYFARGGRDRDTSTVNKKAGPVHPRFVGVKDEISFIDSDEADDKTTNHTPGGKDHDQSSHGIKGAKKEEDAPDDPTTTTVLPNMSRPLTFGEFDKLADYVEAGYIDLNKNLREGKELTPDQQELSDTIQGVMADAKPLPKNMKTYRGIPFRNGDEFDDFMVNLEMSMDEKRPIEFKSYVSTSTDKRTAEVFSEDKISDKDDFGFGVTLEIEPKTGLHLDNMAEISGFGEDEDEVLQSPGTRYEVISVSQPFDKEVISGSMVAATVKLREI